MITTDTVPRLQTVLDWGNIVCFSEFFIVFYELGLILNPFRYCLEVFKRRWGSVFLFRIFNNLYCRKLILDRWVKFSILFDDLGLILYLFRCSMKVFKRHWGSVSPFRSYPTICIGENQTLDGWVSSPFNLMILGSFFIYSDTVCRFSRETRVPCPHSQVIQQSVLGKIGR